jgi:hypothetical protein
MSVNNRSRVYKSGPEFITPDGSKKFYKGKGRKSDRNIDTWEDKKQDAYLKVLEEKRNNVSISK